MKLIGQKELDQFIAILLEPAASDREASQPADAGSSLLAPGESTQERGEQNAG